jgi:glycerol-3-phosphate dehydrogenase
MGPTAEDIEDKEGINTTAAGLDTVLAKASASIRTVPRRSIITSFAGLRA